MRRLPRPTYANVVVTLALFIALGGAAYAATQLPKNSVGAKQLKKNSVTSPKVKDHSLKAVDFQEGELPRGERGERGARGEAGPRGPSGLAEIHEIVNTGTVQAGGTIQVKVECGPNEVATGGGAFDEGNGEAVLYQSGPLPPGVGMNETPTGWAVNYKAGGTAIKVFAYALCAAP